MYFKEVITYEPVNSESSSKPPVWLTVLSVCVEPTFIIFFMTCQNRYTHTLFADGACYNWFGKGLSVLALLLMSLVKDSKGGQHAAHRELSNNSAPEKH